MLATLTTTVRRQRIADRALPLIGAAGRRALDVVVASALLVAAVPLIVVLATAVAVTLRAWPFFVQSRVGLRGERFRFVKLRTLPPAAPAYADKYQIGQLAIPAVCRFLRATHLDELPQLLLVLTGRMSLVGPRPEMPHLHETLPAAQRLAREGRRPGCSGLWQISPDNRRLISEAPHYDLFYAEHSSVRLDVWVLCRTAMVMLGGRRVALADVPRWARRRDVPVVVLDDPDDAEVGLVQRALATT